MHLFPQILVLILALLCPHLQLLNQHVLLRVILVELHIYHLLIRRLFADPIQLPLQILGPSPFPLTSITQTKITKAPSSPPTTAQN